MRANDTPTYRNPYCATMGLIALAAIPLGLILMFVASDEGAVLGSAIFGVGVLTFVAWLAVEAILWRAPAEVPARVAVRRSPSLRPPTSAR